MLKMMIYGAKSVTRFDCLKDEDGDPAFEERVVSLHAKDAKEAIELSVVFALPMVNPL